jgi:hypothetical protein
MRNARTPRQTTREGEQRPDVREVVRLVVVEDAGPIATSTPVQIVLPNGVPNCGWILRNHCGSRPSRLIEKKMRVCPSWNTSSTAVIEMTAPSGRG